MSTPEATALVATLVLILGTIWVAARDEGWRRGQGRAADPQRRALAKLGLVLSIGLIGLAGRLTYVSMIRAKAVRTRTGADANGDVLSNPRVIAAALNAGRGSVMDKSGGVMAETSGEGRRARREFNAPEAAHLLGYFSPLRYGFDGIERSRNEALSGTDPLTVEEAIKSIVRTGAGDGHSVRLTIDPGLQQLAANLLSQTTGSATLIDPRSGRILAMASSPAYDPNALTTNVQSDIASADAAWTELLANDNRPLLVRPTSGLYPPGSTFKVFTAAAAIDAGAVQQDTVFEDNGSLTVNGRVIPEFNRPDESRTDWTVAEALAWSLNVVYAQIGLTLGSDRFRDAAHRFGIGEAIPFEFPVESGQVAGKNSLDDEVALADTAFGQGELLVTPLHMALVMCAVANGGRIPKPILVDAVLNPDGSTSTRSEPSIWRRPISAQTADTVLSMLYESVAYGYASRAAIAGLNVAGKTGTAESGRDAPHGWFIGSAGPDAPSVVVSVCLDYGGEGGGLALEIGRELLAASATL
jgi:peptidoglycan glycosyltransferase